jgi:hypothetical protein
VRFTDFWQRMDAQFGSGYAASIAADQVLPQLGGRTAVQALESGEDAKLVWRAICETFEVPSTLH